MRTLVTALRDPESVAALNGPGWSALLSVARAEVLLGTLAYRLADVVVPDNVRVVLDAARTAADQAQVHALWEAEMCRRALAPLGIEPILLKGTAYAAANLPNAAGRQIGDLDILVPRDRLDEVEAALLAAGWEWVKDDPYDHQYYRRHMHELPPLIHRERDRMIDVHHTILPLTARVTPNARALMAEAVDLPLPLWFPEPYDDWPGEPDPAAGVDAVRGLRVLDPYDIVLHCVAHLIADGDLAGGIRNLWDFHCLTKEMERRTGGKYWTHLSGRAGTHQLYPALTRAARLARHLFDPDGITFNRNKIFWRAPSLTDRLFLSHLLARDDWGRETRPVLRLGFYIRSHLLRMPLPMLLRHLWVKWRKGQG
jgi:Uncharacterised nucleotidyltransferase